MTGNTINFPLLSHNATFQMMKSMVASKASVTICMYVTFEQIFIMQCTFCAKVSGQVNVTQAKLETRESEKNVLANNTFKALFVRENHLVPYAVKVSLNMQFPPIEEAKLCKKASKPNFKFLFRN